MTPERIQIGRAVLWHGDARELLPELRGHAAVISDPPYGQRYKVNTFYAGGTRSSLMPQRNGTRMRVDAETYPALIGDDAPFDPAPWLDLAPVVMLWGAHKFADRLPPGGWLVWDKVPTGKLRHQGDGEAAWVNVDRPLRIFRLLWDGLCVGSAARSEVTAGQKRLHPTQKPVALMEWCIEQAGRPASVVDPFMGSGSTGVAAVSMGSTFTGVEMERRYFDRACERIQHAQAQRRLVA